MANEVAKANPLAGLDTVQSLKAMTQPGTSYQRRFEEVMGKKAPKFIASLISATQQNYQLQKCDPMEIMQASMIAATLDLDIVSSLGFAAIVPFRDSKTGEYHPQFEVMTKGLVQLGTRSGQYRKMNAGLVYKDELKGYDIITGDVKIVPVDGGMRSKDEGGNTLEDLDKAGVAGAFAYFQTVSGYEKMAYWPLADIINHGKRYSQSYRSDIRYGKQSSLWTTNLRAMAIKTVLKNTLSKWGPLSTSMEMAITEDQKVYVGDSSDYLDNQPDELPEEVKGRKEAAKSRSKGAKGLEAILQKDEKPAEAPSEPETPPDYAEWKYTTTTPPTDSADDAMDGNGMVDGSLFETDPNDPAIPF